MQTYKGEHPNKPGSHKISPCSRLKTQCHSPWLLRQPSLPATFRVSILITCSNTPVTPNSVLPSQYGSHATIPHASLGKGLEIEIKTQETMVIRKRTAECHFIQLFAKLIYFGPSKGIPSQPGGNLVPCGDSFPGRGLGEKEPGTL